MPSRGAKAPKCANPSLTQISDSANTRADKAAWGVSLHDSLLPGSAAGTLAGGAGAALAAKTRLGRASGGIPGVRRISMGRREKLFVAAGGLVVAA